MSVINNLVGKRVFNASSAAPNRGPVSASGAQGYLRREQGLNHQVPNRTPFVGSSAWGADGQSDTRSGVAAQSLQNNPSNVPQQQEAGPTVVQGTTPGLFTAPPKPVSPPTSISPTVQITDAGKLKLPYNFKSAASILTQKQKADADIAALIEQRQKAALAYQQQANEVTSQYGDLRLGTLNEAAARGSAFSSGYGKKVAKNATKFNTALGDLTTQEELSKSTDVANRARIAAAFRTYLSQAALNQGYTLDSKAGKLNLKKKPKKKAKKK